MLMVCYDGNMTHEANSIITVNAGSSSIKVAVFTHNPDIDTMSQIANITISDIGQPSSTLRIASSAVREEAIPVMNHTEGGRLLVQRIRQMLPDSTVRAVGHRLVHGGMKFTRSVFVSEITDQDWQLLEKLDPLHTPAAHYLIEHFARYMPEASQVACFDTAFFHDLPHEAAVVPIAKKYYSSGVRRYGFHGLSYESLLEAFNEQAGELAANGRVIFAHLGSGASITAMRSGRPIDTTMGFTPASGLVMSTRSGDLDPNIFGFLRRQNDIDLETFERMVNSESGLLGVSGISGDMKRLLDMENENEDARLAITLFVNSVKKSIGAFSALLGGVDSLIFSGGIGEQSPVLRARICQGLEHLGIEIDANANQQNDFLISTHHSGVGVHVLPSNEAHIIAAQTNELLKESEI